VLADDVERFSRHERRAEEEENLLGEDVITAKEMVEEKDGWKPLVWSFSAALFITVGIVFSGPITVADTYNLRFYLTSFRLYLLFLYLGFIWRRNGCGTLPRAFLILDKVGYSLVCIHFSVHEVIGIIMGFSTTVSMNLVGPISMCPVPIRKTHCNLGNVCRLGYSCTPSPTLWMGSWIHWRHVHWWKRVDFMGGPSNHDCR
jgi:hypothetical protein